MEKKRKKIFIAIGSCLLLALLYINFIKISNIFDQIYYSRVADFYEMTPLSNMKQLNPLPRGAESYYKEEGFYEESYKSEYLDENQYITIFFSVDRKMLFFSLRLHFVDSDENLWLGYSYDIKKKTLTKDAIGLRSDHYEVEYTGPDIEEAWVIDDFLQRKGITRSEIEELHNCFFYDRVLTDFIEANKDNTRFRIDNLGRYTFIDETVATVDE